MSSIEIFTYMNLQKNMFLGRIIEQTEHARHKEDNFVSLFENK